MDDFGNDLGLDFSVSTEYMISTSTYGGFSWWPEKDLYMLDDSALEV